MVTDFGLTIRGQAIVITSGTFLRGLLHVGEKPTVGGEWRIRQLKSERQSCRARL